MGGSGRGANRGGRARSGSTGWQHNCSPRNNCLSYLPLYRRHNPSTSFQKHEQAKSNVNRAGEQNHRLTSGLYPVSLQDEGRSLFLAADQWTDLFFPVNPFLAKCDRKFTLILHTTTLNHQVKTTNSHRPRMHYKCSGSLLLHGN